MMRLLVLLTFCGIFAGYGQILDNTEGKTFGEKPFFNEAFVKRNKIKTIKGHYSTKAELDYIRKSKDIYVYTFNENGQLIQDYRTQYGDTIIAMYGYNDQGHLSVMRRSDNDGFHAYHYRYDDKGRMIEKEYRRDVNKGNNKINFKLDKSFVVSIERFEYIDLEGDNYKKIYLNNAGKIYKEEFFYFNEDGYLLEQEGRLKMGSGLTKTTFKYDEKGRVSEKEILTRIMGNYTSKWVYEYDEHGDVLAQHFYKKGEYIREYQLVYFPETLLLKAIITREEENNFVTILEFTNYTYYQ